MANIFTPGGGAFDGFPDRLVGPGENGGVDNGRHALAEVIERAERACHVLAARRKITVAAIVNDMLVTYPTDGTAPLALVCKENFTKFVSAEGFFSVDNVASTFASDVQATIGINSTENATYTTTAVYAPVADTLYRFSIEPHLIGGGDNADLETQEVGIQISWTGGASTDTLTVHSITLILEPMSEVTA